MPLKLTRLEKLRRIRRAIRSCGLAICHSWSERRASGLQRTKWRCVIDRTADFSIGQANLKGCILTMFPDAVIQLGENRDYARNNVYFDIIVKTPITS